MSDYASLWFEPSAKELFVVKMSFNLGLLTLSLLEVAFMCVSCTTKQLTF